MPSRAYEARSRAPTTRIHEINGGNSRRHLTARPASTSSGTRQLAGPARGAGPRPTSDSCSSAAQTTSAWRARAGDRRLRRAGSHADDVAIGERARDDGLRAALQWARRAGAEHDRSSADRSSAAAMPSMFRQWSCALGPAPSIGRGNGQRSTSWRRAASDLPDARPRDLAMSRCCCAVRPLRSSTVCYLKPTRRGQGC